MSNELAERLELAAKVHEDMTGKPNAMANTIREGARFVRKFGSGEGVMHGRIVEANFPDDTITLRMESGYYAAAGRYQVRPAPETTQEPPNE